jgi:hypothetical protein
MEKSTNYYDNFKSAKVADIELHKGSQLIKFKLVSFNPNDIWATNEIIEHSCTFHELPLKMRNALIAEGSSITEELKKMVGYTKDFPIEWWSKEDEEA